jgi:hypothetical protein
VSTSSEEDARYRGHHRRSKRRSELDEELILKLDKLNFLEKHEADREYEEKMERQSQLDEDLVLKIDKPKEELEILKARELYERGQKAKKERELRKEYVERWKREEAEEKEKEEEDRKFEERFKSSSCRPGIRRSRWRRRCRTRRRRKEANESDGN